MANESDVNIVINVDTSQAIKATQDFSTKSVQQIKEINSALSDFSRNWMNTNKTISSSGVNPFAAWSAGMKGTEAAFKTSSTNIKSSADLWQASIAGGLNAFKSWGSASASIDSATSATQRFSKSTRDLDTTNLPRLRYSLYDISSAAGNISSVLGSGVSSVIKSTTEYETAFTAVERTTNLSGEAAKVLKKQLMDLATQIPLTFQDIAGITTLGAQMGVANSDLTAFTKNVAEFSTVSGISTEEVAKSFGTIGNLLGITAADYNKFGSSIAAVGNKSAATETQILSMVKKISGISVSAGFSTKDIIGLSAALASLGVAPQRAAGALTRTFQEINRATAAGGKQLQDFATVMNMSAGEAGKLAQTDMSGFFNKFVSSLKGMNPAQITKTFDALKLSGSETVDVLSRLSQSFGIVTQYQTLAGTAYADGTFLADAYAKKVDDIASKFAILQNAVSNFSVVLGSSFSPIIGSVLDALKNIVIGFTDMMANPAIAWIGQAVLVIGGLGAALFATISALAMFTAGSFAAHTALVGFAEAGVLPNNTLTQLIGKLFGVDVAAVTAQGTADRLAAAEARVAAAAAEAGGALAIEGAEMDGAAVGAGALAIGMDGVAVAEEGAAVGAKSFKTALISTGIGAIVVLLGTLAAAFIGANDAAGQAATGNSELKDSQGRTQKQIDEANASIDEQNTQLQALGSNASGAAKSIRTLGDYANDLSSTFSRAFEIRYDTRAKLDNITTGWKSMGDATEKAKNEVKSLNSEIDGLTADKALQEYFLSVATAYGDTLTSSKLSANISKIDTQLVDKNNALTDAQDASNKTLVGGSIAAINNRKTITGMVTSYQAYIQSLAASGASQETISAAVKQSKADFIAQATQLGYNTTELQTYTASFTDMSTIINAIPRDVTINANTTPALTALDEFVTKAGAAGADGAAAFSNSFKPQVKIPDIDVKTKVVPQAQVEYDRFATHVKAAIQEGFVSAGDFYSPHKITTPGANGMPWYADGGYTGTGSKYETAGIVHKGEYVVPQSQVNQMTGLPYYMSQPRTFANGGFTGQQGPTMVVLSPEDRAILRNAGGSGEVVLYANNEALARSTNAGNRSIVATGGQP
jgi:TP901 family phage tail tape measure protein